MPRIHHLALRTRDVPRLVAFYRAWFGLRTVRDLSPRAEWLTVGDDAVLMVEQAGAEEPSIPPGSLELVAFHVSADEFADLRARLAAQGLLEAETPFTVYFRDPDGRRVGASRYPLPESEKPRPT